MLIHSYFTLFDNVQIKIPSWIRSPAGLKRNLPVNLTLTEFDEAASQIVISPIDYKFWRDLWLIELVCNEAPNIAKTIVELLDDLRIRIISMSTCRIQQGEMHTVTIVCDCSSYASRIDGGLKKRLRISNPMLDQLEAIIVSELIDHLVIYDDENPAISLRRMNPYYEMWHSEKSERAPNYAEIDSEGSMTIPQYFIQQIRNKCLCVNEDQMYYQLSVDTRDRLVRINFFRTDDNIYIFRLIFDTDANAMKTIFEVISHNRFDVVGCQMNFLSERSMKELSNKSQKFASLDIVLRSLSNEEGGKYIVIKKLVNAMRSEKGNAIILDEKSVQ